MGRAQESLLWLAGRELPEEGWARALLGQDQTPCDSPERQGYLDRPQACLALLEAEPAEPLRALLGHWARRRLGLDAHESAAHVALVRAAQQAPSDEARGLALHALACAATHPFHALPHLDHALAVGARFGIHHLDCRLLAMKARALEQAGLLRDSERFERAAAEAERRLFGK